MIRRPPRSTRTDTLFPYTTRFRSEAWGDDTVLALSKLSSGQRRLFASLPLSEATLPPEALGPTLLEPHPSWMTRIERSEEHTSELQSLMRISYAVFCLTKTTNSAPPTNSTPHGLTPHTADTS